MLRENTTPAIDTRHSIEEIIRRDHADISFLDREISKLQTTLLDLKRQRRTIQTRVDRNTAFLAPIRRVPVEILQQIFTFCFLYVTTYDLKWLPFQISHVSAHWRFVASTFPDLWSRIDFHVHPLTYDESREEMIRICDRFMSLAHDRSGTRPITVSVCPPFGMDLIKSFGLVSAISKILFKLRGICKLPVVRYLELTDESRNDASCTLPPIMTRLTHLSLVDCSAPVARLINMPWSQITYLEAHYIPINDLGAALCRMPNLTHAYLAPVGTYTSALQGICLPQLRVLTLRSPRALICAIAESLTTPILSRFQVIGESGPDAPQGQSLGKTLRTFIHRSSSPVTHLGLQNVSSQNTKNLFEGLGTVESLDLSIENSKAVKRIINQLVWSAQPNAPLELDATNLLPNLQVLTVRRKKLNGALPGIIQMIGSRMDHSITLAGDTIPARPHTVRVRSMDSLAPLVQLHQQGVVVDCMHELGGACGGHLDISNIQPLELHDLGAHILDF